MKNEAGSAVQMLSISAGLADAINHLSSLADGWEIAADCERRIEAAYEPEMERWEVLQEQWRALSIEDRAAWQRDDRLTRKVRNALDARNNARRFDKDAKAVRDILAEIERLSA